MNSAIQGSREGIRAQPQGIPFVVSSSPGAHHEAEMPPLANKLPASPQDGGPQALALRSPSTEGVAPRAGKAALETVVESYQMEPVLDELVLPGRMTELWAAVYRPKVLADQKYPLLVFLHGNHETCGTGENPRRDNDCSYTRTGTCPDGYEVVPNHLGYGYVAKQLAAQGYIVVSINANRGITCGNGIGGDFGLNLARGRLVLRHLQQLSAWNQEGGAPLAADLKGKIDFSQVGMMGHSRGGEGVRAAYNQYRDEGSLWPALIGEDVGFRAIYEIAPVDGQTSRTLDADGVAWNVLLPMCDGDVSDLQGVRPFDRMIDDVTESPALPKSTTAVWGTNHNFFNSEWQRSDSRGCGGHEPIWTREGGPELQREISAARMLSFFKGYVGKDADPAAATQFNPEYAVSDELAEITRLDRGYNDSANAEVTTALETFSKPRSDTSDRGVRNRMKGVKVKHAALRQHDHLHRGAIVRWTAKDSGAYFQNNWTRVRKAIDLSKDRTLSFRVARDEHENNVDETTDFTIHLVHGSGRLSKGVKLSSLLQLNGPVGGRWDTHSILQTVRIPLSAFEGVRLSQIRGIRFAFDATESGSIYLSDISVSKLGRGSLGGVSGQKRSPAVVEDLYSLAPAPEVVTADRNRIVAIRSREAGSLSIDCPEFATHEIEVASEVPFEAKNSLLVLRIGNTESFYSRRPETGELDRLLFALSPENIQALEAGEKIEITYSSAPAAERPIVPLSPENLEALEAGEKMVAPHPQNRGAKRWLF